MAGRIDFVLDDGHDQAAADDVGDALERALGSLALREVHDLEVVGLELGAELQVVGCHDHGLRRRRDRLDRLIADHVVGPVRETSACQNGDRENGKNSAAHMGSPSSRFS